MAGTGLASGVKTRLYATETKPTVSTTPVYGDFVGAGNKDIVKSGTNGEVNDTNLVELVTDLGDLVSSANTIGFNVYGEGTQRNIAGFANLEEWTFTIALDEAKALHRSLMDADVGDTWYFVVLTYTTDHIEKKGSNSSKATGATAVYAYGEVGGKAIQTPTDGPRALEVTITLSEEPIVVRGPS